MQTLGLAVTAAPREAARAVATARPHVASALHEHDPENGDDEDDDDDTVRGWQTAYYALLLIEKAAARCPEALTSDASSLSAGADDDDRIASDAVTGPAGRFDAPDAVWTGAQALLLQDGLKILLITLISPAALPSLFPPDTKRAKRLRRAMRAVYTFLESVL